MVRSVEVRQNPGEGIYTPPLGSGDGVGEARLSHETKAELLAVLHNVAVSGGYIGEPVGQGLDQLSHVAIVGNVDGHRQRAAGVHPRRGGEGPRSPGIWKSRNRYGGTSHVMCIPGAVREGPTEGVVLRRVGSGDGVGEARLSHETKAELLAVLSQRRREWWIHR